MVSTPQCLIRPAEEKDFSAIEALFRSVMQTGDTYLYFADMPSAEIRNMWMSDRPYVAYVGDHFVGTFVIRPNKVDRGSHVCNAGFMVSPEHRGKGLGRALGEYALSEAKRLGYKAMQFNVVVSTNERAVNLWKSLGFTIAGMIPQGFQHQDKGLVDIFIMHRFL